MRGHGQQRVRPYWAGSGSGSSRLPLAAFAGAAHAGDEPAWSVCRGRCARRECETRGRSRGGGIDRDFFGAPGAGGVVAVTDWPRIYTDLRGLFLQGPSANYRFAGVIIERFSTIKIAVCVDDGEDSRFLASLGMTNWLEA